MKIAFDWQISAFFGWGVYGLNVALEWAHDPAIEASGLIRSLDEIAVDRLRKRVLAPFVRRSLAGPPDDALLIHSLGNECDGYLTRPSKVGAIFFERPMSPAAIDRAKSYDVIVAGSSWNERLLRDRGVTNVKTILQGVDPSLCHLAPRRGLFRDKFVIFSGGKAEHRKGQDIVVKAFRIFAQRHPDAMLVTAWHSPWVGLAKGMDLDLSGLADRVIDVGVVPNAQMPAIYRECDLAVFPNRAEGGTNLVAMECMACGVPALISANTGHLDLLDRRYGYPLEQHPHADGALAEMGWGETPVEELVEKMEMAKRLAYGPRAFRIAQELTWSRTARELLQTIKDIAPAISVAA